MTRILSRITKRMLCVALECWIRWCSEEFALRNQQRAEERNAHIIQSVLHKMLKNRVSAALFAWKGVVFRKRYLKYISAKAVKLSERLVRGVEMKCWGTWTDYVHHRRQFVAGETIPVLHLVSIPFSRSSFLMWVLRLCLDGKDDCLGGG